MKKITAFILLAVLCLSFASCGGAKGEAHKLGDTVSTDICELKLNYAQFTTALSNINDDKYFSPKEYDASTDNDNPYVAPTGKSYIAFSYTIKNLDRANLDIDIDSIAKTTYNKKSVNKCEPGAYYLYSDKQVMSATGSLSTESKGNWYKNNADNMILDPSEKRTVRAYFLIDADVKDPKETVEITFSIPKSDGKKEKFTFTVTQSDRDSYKGTEIEMDFDLAIATFTTPTAREYLKAHLNEYPVVDINSFNFTSKKWNVSYVGSAAGSIGTWTGHFEFETTGKIKDDYGYVNERTWEIKDSKLILDGEDICEMRNLKDTRKFLLTINSEPYMIMY